MLNKRFNVKLLVSAITLSLSAGAMATEHSQDEFDHELRLRLKNELRLADRPSAAPSNEIEAWVQGFMFDYETQNLASWLDVDAFAYTVQKLIANPEKSTRFYLDGHDSFSFIGASLNLKPINGLEIKLGRFGNDNGYGTMDHIVPLLEYTSVRTMPSIKEGGMFQYSIDDLHFYGAMTTKTAGGYDTEWKEEGILDSSYQLVKESPKYYLATVYDAKMEAASLGFRYQDDHSIQALSNMDYAFLTTDGAFVKFDTRFFYADLLGLQKELHEKTGNDNNSTYVASGQVTYAKDNVYIVGGIGQVGARLEGSTAVDTDIGFPFDMSISRNYHYTTSWQIGTGYNLSDSWGIGLFLVKTDGDLDYKEDTYVDGLGANFTLSYKLTEGSYKGLKSSLILNKAREYRSGASNETLDYYDIKFSLQYDFNLI